MNRGILVQTLVTCWKNVLDKVNVNTTLENVDITV